MKALTECLLLVVLGALGLEAGEPTLAWDFDRWDGGSAASAGRRQVNLVGKAAPGAGVGGSGGLCCDGTTRSHAAFLDLDWARYTMELQFRLDRPLDGGFSRALVSYETDSWDRRRLILLIKGDGRLAADFRMVDRQDREKDIAFQLESEEQRLEPGRFHTVRLAGVSGGPMKLWLDGRLVAAREKAPGLLDLKSPRRIKWYPVLALGFDNSNPPHIRKAFHGVVDNLRLWDTFEEPAPPEDQAGAGEVSPHLVLDGEWSRPFRVLDREQGQAGNLVMAEDRFVRNAGRASARISGGRLVVAFDCPIPEGMKTRSGRSVWAGDVVEFFIRPDRGKERYFQYAASPSGARFAREFSAPLAPVDGFVSRFEVRNVNTPGRFTVEMSIPLEELGIEQPAPGTTFSGNFTRSGGTAGGLSTWAPMGESFHNPDGFRPLIAGGRRAYFERRLGEAEPLAARYGIDLAKLRSLIRANGDQASWFDRLNAAFDALQAEMVQKSCKDRRQLVFAADVWGNSLDFNLLTRPLPRIRVVMPMDSLHYIGFAVANLTDRPFLGQIKCFPKKPFQYPGRLFNSEPFDRLCRQIAFSEGIRSWNISGQAQYDAVAPLVLNTLLRMDAFQTVPVWMEISTSGIPAGTHRGVVALKDCTGHPGMTLVDLEVEVRPVDLSKVGIDVFNYTYLQKGRCFAEPGIRNFFGRHENNFVYGTPGQFDFYPEQNDDGSIREMDFRHLDGMIDSAILGGIPRDRIRLNLFLALNTGCGMRRPGKDGHAARFPRPSPRWQRGMRESLQAMQGHLQERYGLEPERVVLYPFDEPNGDIDDPKSGLAEALRYCRFLKEWVPRMKVMVNPHPHRFDEVRRKAFVKLAPYVDIFELYRPNASESPELVGLVKSLGKEIWTYSISNTATHPVNYRLDFWRNMADGFSSIAAYWHLENMAGGDGFDPTDFSWNSRNRTDYGTVYADFNYGTIIPGRRFLAARLGQEERKVFEYCRLRIEASPRRQELRKRLDAIVARGAKSSMAQLEQVRVELIDFAASLQQ